MTSTQKKKKEILLKNLLNPKLKRNQNLKASPLLQQVEVEQVPV